MKTFFGFFLLLALPMLGFSQNTFQDCFDGQLVDNPQQQAFFGQSSDELSDYFADRLQPIVDNQDPSGRMVLTVVVDSEGAPCLREFNITGDFAIEPNHIKNIVDGMGAWNAAQQDGIAVASQFKLAIRFTNNGVITRQVSRGARN